MQRWRRRGQALNGWLDTWFLFWSLLNELETWDQFSVSWFLPSCRSRVHKSLLFFLHVLCGSGKGLLLCSLRRPMGDVVGVWSTRGYMWIIWYLKQGVFLFLASGGHWTQRGVLDCLSPVCDIYRLSFEIWIRIHSFALFLLVIGTFSCGLNCVCNED